MNPELTREPNEPRPDVVLPAEGAALPEPSLQEWADKVTDASGQAVEKILAIGRVLLTAKKAIKHGEWERMFKGHPQAIDRPVRFSVATAKMYMKIAAHPVLSNRNLCNDLPTSWRALYELTFLPETELQRFLATGDINPETPKAEVQVLRHYLATPQPPQSPRQHVSPQLFEDYPAHRAMLKWADRLMRKFWGEVAAEMRQPLRIEDGRILSGVLWVPPLLPGPAKVSRPMPLMHECKCSSCGHVHKIRSNGA